MSLYLSWDCAYKTLAFAVVCVDNKIIHTIKKIVESLRRLLSVDITEQIATLAHELVKIAHDLLSMYIVVLCCESIDVLGEGVKVASCTNSKRIRCLINAVDSNEHTNIGAIGRLASRPDFGGIIVENQPLGNYKKAKNAGAANNKKSNDVAQALFAYYSQVTPNITAISARRKNKVNFGGQMLVTTNASGQPLSPSAAYTARKKHTKAQLAMLNQVFGYGLPAHKLGSADIADAIIQTLAVHFKL